MKLLKMSNFTFFHNVFYAISILKSFISHISVAACSFFEFGKVSKWCIGERVKWSSDTQISNSIEPYQPQGLYRFISVHFLIDPFPKRALVFTCLQDKSFENTVGKGEIAHYEQFLLFPQCFLSVWRAFCHFQQILKKMQTLSVWKSLKFVVWERVKCIKPLPINPGV